MTESHEFGALTRAFSGFGIGVDEKSLISILGKWHPEQRKSFRKGVSEFFVEDERLFERWDDRHIVKLEREFLRFKNAMVLWTMHPWERDARLAKQALIKGHSQSYGVLIEIACSRSSEELLGARKAYHSLFEHSIEEDVATHVTGIQRKLLVALVSSYRYEGPKLSEETAKKEAKILYNSVKDANKKAIEDEEVIRILTTRSKLHIKAVAQHYKEISSKNIEEDLELDLSLKQTVQCLYTPEAYFSKVLEEVFKNGIDDEEALSRVIVTRADVDMKKIKEKYHQNYGVDLTKKIEESVNGNYRDFLLSLVARGH